MWHSYCISQRRTPLEASMRPSLLAQISAPLFAMVLSACVAGIDGDKGGDPGKPDDNLDIIGGIGDPGHPYVVGVGDTSGAFCSGTVISRRTVITAGHCFGG